jgi:8-oxo-dGTP pyrophosphatase MutT (NUDIX family)
MTESAPAPKVIPAATVVIFRHGTAGGPPELLMVQRAKEMRFAGGAAVFPGGRIDPEDRDLALRLAPEADQEIAAARVAGIRETLEETGLAVAIRQAVSADEAAAARAMLIAEGALAPVLERFGWEVDLDALSYFARWCPMADGAFDTCFFLADLGTGAVEIAVDATENTRLFWASAAEALRRADAGDIHIIFPTRRNLERLAQHTSYPDALTDAETFPARMITPRIEYREGERWLVIPEGHGYPVLGQPKATAKRG